MSENLLKPSNILLYGREVDLLTIARHTNVPSTGGNSFLKEQLSREDVTLARIYAFSFEGHYYDMSRPAIFAVHGKGKLAETEAADPRASRAPSDADDTGVASQARSYSKDMRVWPYDKSDFSLRIDVDSGSFEEILLAAEIIEDDMPTYSGGRVGGGRVGGGRVGGGRVGGGRVGGGRVGGGRVGGGNNSD